LSEEKKEDLSEVADKIKDGLELLTAGEESGKEEKS
jgi:hypothetical protein